MANKHSLHLIPIHTRPQDVDYAAKMNPAVLKFVDAGEDLILNYAHRCPDAILFLRDWALSEQKEDVMRNAAGTGYRHAADWVDKLKTKYKNLPQHRVVVTGINEPQVWADNRGPARDYIQRCNEYWVAFFDGLKLGGVKGAGPNLSVGWPDNTGPDTPPNWAPYEPILHAILRGKHYLCVHEYWPKEGPESDWGWLAGRINKCPWKVPIIIGECGLDQRVSGQALSNEQAGWRRFIDAQTYADQVARYLAKLDRRVIGATTFTTDGAGEWWAFDTDAAREQLARVYVEQGQSAWQPPAPEPEPEPPKPEPGAVHPLPNSWLTQHWGENGDIYKVFGLWGHNGVDFAKAEGTPIRCVADGIVAWSDWDNDYGYYVRVYHEQYNCDSFYAHLGSIGAAKGKRLKKGDTVGLLGNTGNSAGPHLHFEIRMRDPKTGAYMAGTPMPKGRVDPETWLILNGVR